jgi:hypothetical protein
VIGALDRAAVARLGGRAVFALRDWAPVAAPMEAAR